jgi:hypothetical protein
LAKLLNEPQKTFTEKSKGHKALEYLTTTTARTTTTLPPPPRKLTQHHQKSHEKPAESAFTEYTHTQLENILSGDGSPSHNTDLTSSSSLLAKNNGQSQYIEMDEQRTDPTATAATTTTTSTTVRTTVAAGYNEIIVRPGEKTYHQSSDGEGMAFYELNDIDDEQMVTETFDFENFDGEVIGECEFQKKDLDNPIFTYLIQKFRGNRQFT